jgi:hypothetical protein
VQLDGATGYLNARNTIRTDTSFTVSAWGKLSADHSGQHATAVSQLGSGAFPGFQLSYLDNNRWGFSLHRAHNDMNTDFASSPAAMPQPGAWTHLTGVHDATVGAIRLYVNGSLAGSHVGLDHRPGRDRRRGTPDQVHQLCSAHRAAHPGQQRLGLRTTERHSPYVHLDGDGSEDCGHGHVPRRIKFTDRMMAF